MSPDASHTSPEEARELFEARASLNASATAAERADAAYRDARAVFAHVSRRLAHKYSLGHGDLIQPDGTVVRHAPEPPQEA